MSVRIYHDRDVDLSPLRKKQIAVIGFGSQGRAQALNLRDRGLNVIIGLYPGSKSRIAAKRGGFKIFNTAEAVRAADIIFFALPDMKIPRIYKTEVEPWLRGGQTLVFAHGFAIYYRTIVPRNDVDVVMVAPKALGPMVRRQFVDGGGVPGLIAIHQDATGRARKTALAWAKSIGCTRVGVIETTFRDETETDLFGEQAVLCGGTSALIRAGFETLVKAGYPAELAYFECLHELKFIVDLIHEAGLSGMRALISDTARWGELTVGPQIIDRHVRKKMARTLRQIRSGKFARRFIAEMESGQKHYKHLRKLADAHPIERTGRKLRRLAISK